jgi:hypothetical protein
MQVFADSANPKVATFPTIYSISEKLEVGKIQLQTPSGYKVSSLRSFYPAASKVAGLVLATQPMDPSQPTPRGKKYPFLSIADRDGSSQKLITLDLPFEPVKAAMFDSGEFLVLGVDTANIQPVLALLDSDGSLKKMLDLDIRNYSNSSDIKQNFDPKNVGTPTAETQQTLLKALNVAQFVPSGANILLIQPGSALPVYRFTSKGLTRTVNIKPPDGSLIDTILASSERDSWVVRTKNGRTFQRVSTGNVVENPSESLYQVDPLTGSITARIEVKGPQPGEVNCATNRTVSAIFYGLPEDGDTPTHLTYASAPR